MPIDIPTVPDVPPGDDVPQCRLCGCTENTPCPGGCTWAPDPLLMGDLCSTCAIGETARRPPRLLQLLQEVASTRLLMAEQPLVPDMAALPDGTAGVLFQEDLDVSRKWLDSRVTKGHATWADVIALACARACAAEPGRQLRRELIGLAAHAMWWAELIEQRDVLALHPEPPGGTGTPTRP